MYLFISFNKNVTYKRINKLIHISEKISYAMRIDITNATDLFESLK